MELTARGSLLLTACSSGLAFNYSSFFFFAAKWRQFSSTAPNLIFKGKALNLTATIHLLTLHPSVYSSMGCVEKARPQLSSTW